MVITPISGTHFDMIINNTKNKKIIVMIEIGTHICNSDVSHLVGSLLPPYLISHLSTHLNIRKLNICICQQRYPESCLSSAPIISPGTLITHYLCL